MNRMPRWLKIILKFYFHLSITAVSTMGVCLVIYLTLTSIWFFAAVVFSFLTLLYLTND